MTGHNRELTQATTLTPTTLSLEKPHIFMEIISTGASMIEGKLAQGPEKGSGPPSWQHPILR